MTATLPRSSRPGTNTLASSVENLLTMSARYVRGNMPSCEECLACGLKAASTVYDISCCPIMFSNSHTLPIAFVKYIQKLEFYLQIYFAVFPVVHGGGRSAAESMTAFKAFLETRGAALAQTAEFLPYYALPFVSNLREHPSFELLFSSAWAAGLRAQLERLIGRPVAGASDPALCTAWAMYTSSSASSRGRGGGGGGDSAAAAELAEVRAELAEADEEARMLADDLSILQRNYHTLIGTAAELVEALESSIRGTLVKPEYLIKIVGQLNGFSSVSQSQMMRHVKKEKSVVGAGAHVNTTTAAPRRDDAADARRPHVGGHDKFAAAMVTAAPLPQLNDAKIRKHLLTQSDRNVALLLQALRWRVTRSVPGPQRKAVLDAFAINDYLGVGQHPGGPIYVLVHSASVDVREYMTRLLNCLASIAKGREYAAPTILLANGEGDVYCN